MTLTQTEYRNVPGYSGYRAGSDGSIWSCWQRIGDPRGRGCQFVIGSEWRRLSPTPKVSGHLQVQIRGKRMVMVHKFVLLAFVGPCLDGMQCCHQDGDPANNVIGNIRWDTPKANKSDSIRHGTPARGEKTGNAKLTEAIVIDARRRHKAGESIVSIARRQDISAPAMGDAISGRTWAHVQEAAS